MRWHILRTLLHKEVLRHLANRGGLAMLLLLIVASLLLSFFGGADGPGGGLTGGVQRCYVDYWEDGPLVDHLLAHVPPELARQIVFRSVRQSVTDEGGRLVYPHNTGSIQLRARPGDLERGTFQVLFWHPGTDRTALAPFEAWFWKEALHYYQARAAQATGQPSDGSVLKGIESASAELQGGMDSRSGLATALVLFGLFFVCVYLLPSLNCEERERGVLLAQVLSPASPREILAARYLFYPFLALLLAVVLAATYHPHVLTSGFFWLALLVAVCGAMGIGLTIASLARTQRAASMGAMCYMLAVALVLFICQQNQVPVLPWCALEYHCPRMLHAALTDAVTWAHWAHLGGAAVLAAGWTAVATVLFRRYGWQ
jgi:hypothetical protein